MNQLKQAVSLPLALSLSLALSHTHSLTHSHTLSLCLTLSFSLYIYPSLSLSFCLSRALSLQNEKAQASGVLGRHVVGRGYEPRRGGVEDSAESRLETREGEERGDGGGVEWNRRETQEEEKVVVVLKFSKIVKK